MYLPVVWSVILTQYCVLKLKPLIVTSFEVNPVLNKVNVESVVSGYGDAPVLYLKVYGPSKTILYNFTFNPIGIL